MHGDTAMSWLHGYISVFNTMTAEEATKISISLRAYILQIKGKGAFSCVEPRVYGNGVYSRLRSSGEGYITF
ncbi:hypothetical protein C5167_050639 [Papaver somniferum]|uniref:Uncharacterized protein n=1 Tax=Papaver somniferum TaxID=3469 RepID=A0A4Y7KQL8_PAPSO|nr:hypothetical protein C5167_050639 [Papaver somniferum]